MGVTQTASAVAEQLAVLNDSPLLLAGGHAQERLTLPAATVCKAIPACCFFVVELIAMALYLSIVGSICVSFSCLTSGLKAVLCHFHVGRSRSKTLCTI